MDKPTLAPWGSPQVLAELGSEAHPNRLTIFLARPNGNKGSMFTGNEPTSKDKYKNMPQDQQLQSVKEMGMVFSYLNTPEIWSRFCGTYEAIYHLLGHFDTYASGQGVAITSLQAVWKLYIRVVLDSLVLHLHASFDFMNAH